MTKLRYVSHVKAMYKPNSSILDNVVSSVTVRAHYVEVLQGFGLCESYYCSCDLGGTNNFFFLDNRVQWK